MYEGSSDKSRGCRTSCSTASRLLSSFLFLTLLLPAPSAQAATPAFVQVNSAAPQAVESSVPVTFGSAQKAGDLNVILVGWNDTTSSVSSVTDSLGNTYTLADKCIAEGYAGVAGGCF